MIWNRTWVLGLSLCLSTWFASLPVQAAGYYAFEIGPKAVGRAGAVVVNPNDPTALWLNPAAITKLRGLQLRLDGAAVFLQGEFQRDCGSQNDCGPRDFKVDYGADRGYEVKKNRAPADDENIFEPKSGNLGRFGTASDFSDGHTVKNQAGPQPIPGIWATSSLDLVGLPNGAVGFALYAPYAGDYAYGADEYTRYSLIERDLLEVYYQATFAYQFGQWLALGASLQGVSAGVRQQVKLSADRYGNEIPDSDILIELNTLQNFIPSGNFGIWSSPLPGLQLGASVQLGRSVQSSGSLRILELGQDIQDLVDSGSVTLDQQDPKAKVSFEMPAYLRAGVLYGQNDLLDGFLDYEVEVDFVYEQWSAYNHVLLESSGISIGQGGEPTPLEPLVQPREWEDAWSVRAGGEIELWENLVALRGGLMYERAAIPTRSLNVELLNGEKIGVGIGSSLKLWGCTLDIGYGHHFVFDRVVDDESIIYLENPVRTFNPEPRTRVAMGKYSMSYDVLSVGLNVAFDEVLGTPR